MLRGSGISSAHVQQIVSSCVGHGAAPAPLLLGIRRICGRWPGNLQAPAGNLKTLMRLSATAPSSAALARTHPRQPVPDSCGGAPHLLLSFQEPMQICSLHRHWDGGMLVHDDAHLHVEVRTVRVCILCQPACYEVELTVCEWLTRRQYEHRCSGSGGSQQAFRENLDHLLNSQRPAAAPLLTPGCQVHSTTHQQCWYCCQNFCGHMGHHK